MSVKSIRNIDEFNEYLLNDKFLVVDFRAPWCAPCKQLDPILEEISKRYQEVLFLKVNVKELPLIGAKYFVKSLPTVIFFVNGKADSSFTGTVNKRMIEKKILSFFPFSLL